MAEHATTRGTAALAAAAVDRPERRPLSPAPLGFRGVAYLGEAALLLLRSAGSAWGRDESGASLLGESARQADRLVGLGVGVVAAVHVGMGSFLAMQAYFGATFVDGVGPVVGVGLIRNLAPLLAGFLLAILASALFVADLRTGHAPPRMAATRVLGAMVAGPILAAWGALVGVAVGWLVSRSMLGVSDPVFFDLFLEMLWARDVISLVAKGALFGGAAALLACHEGGRLARLTESPGPDAAARAACRAAGLAALAILAINGGWFLLFYHAGPAFGPTLLVPPGR